MGGGGERVDGLSPQPEVAALVEEALGVAGEEEAFGAQELRVPLDEVALRGLVEVDHHVAAEDRVEPGLHAPARVHEVDARELHARGELAADARLAVVAPRPLEEETL